MPTHSEADNIMVKTRADSSFGKSDESYEFLSAPLRIRKFEMNDKSLVTYFKNGIFSIKLD